MAPCTICLELKAKDTAPTTLCVRDVLEYIDLNRRLVEEARKYHKNERHLAKCQHVEYERQQNEESQPHTMERLNMCKDLHTRVNFLLRKRLPTQSLVAGVPVATRKPPLCPALTPLLQATVDIPNLVKSLLDIMDQRFSDEAALAKPRDSKSWEFAQMDFGWPENRRSGPGADEVAKATHLKKQLIALNICRLRVIEARAAASLSTLTPSILKLPSEIKDMIYHHLVVNEDSKVRLEGEMYYKSRRHRMTIKPENKHNVPQIYPNEWCLNPSIVGLIMAREITEVYYTKNTFLIKEPKDIQKLMCDVPDGIETPPSTLIRGIEIAWVNFDYRREGFEEVQHELRWLVDYPHKHPLHVSIHIRSSDYDEDYLLSSSMTYALETLYILEMLKRVVYELKHAGDSIVVKQYSHDNQQVRELIYWDASETASARRDAGFFGKTKEQLEEEAYRNRYQFVGFFGRPSPTSKGAASQLKKGWGVKNAKQGFQPIPPGSSIPEWSTDGGMEQKYLDIENDSSDEEDVDDEDYEDEDEDEDEDEAEDGYNAFGVRHHPFGNDDDSFSDDDCWYQRYAEDSDSDAHPSLFD